MNRNATNIYRKSSIFLPWMPAMQGELADENLLAVDVGMKIPMWYRSTVMDWNRMKLFIWCVCVCVFVWDISFVNNDEQALLNQMIANVQKTQQSSEYTATVLWGFLIYLPRTIGVSSDISIASFFWSQCWRLAVVGIHSWRTVVDVPSNFDDFKLRPQTKRTWRMKEKRYLLILINIYV